MFWHKFSTVSALVLDIENTCYEVHGEYILEIRDVLAQILNSQCPSTLVGLFCLLTAYYFLSSLLTAAQTKHHFIILIVIIGIFTM